MSNEQRFPKWAEMKAKYQQQLEKLEKAKMERRDNLNFVTTQQHINKLSKMAHS